MIFFHFYCPTVFILKFSVLDLKPENILVTFDSASERCIDLKLCDFGLSTKFSPRVMLTDFCGSPGTLILTDCAINDILFTTMSHF